MSLEGRNAVVTGAGSGIGRACAVVLAQKGAAVAVWDLDAAGAEATVAEIREAGGKALAVVGSAADPATITAEVARVRAELGPVTILVNNAGVAGQVPFLEITEEFWDRTIAVNLTGPFLVTRALVPDMLEAGWGRIVNISSSSTQGGSPNMAAYVSSKGGLVGFTRALATEFADKGITVNTVPPGTIDTPMLRRQSDPERIAPRMPMKRTGQPEDIAHAVAYLASEEAGYVTGHTLSVNGGRYFN